MFEAKEAVKEGDGRKQGEKAPDAAKPFASQAVTQPEAAKPYRDAAIKEDGQESRHDDAPEKVLT